MGDTGVPVSLLTIAITVLCTFAGFASRQTATGLAESPWEILHEGRWYQMLTSGFLHVDLGHLFMNMFTLFFFGPPIERILGAKGFVILYMGSLFAGSLLTLLMHHADKNYRALGASGAVTGVVFGFVLFFPFAPIYIFFIPIGIPAILFAGGYMLISIIGARSRTGRIGHAAHLGGAIGGLLLTLALEPKAGEIFLSHFR